MKALEWSQQLSHYKSMEIFPGAQGQLTHKSLSDPAEFQTCSRFYSCPCYLQEKTWTNQKWRSQSGQNYNPMGASCCHGNQSFDPIWLKKRNAVNPPSPIMPQMKFDYDRPTSLRDIHVWKCECTHGGRHGWRLETHPISSFGAFGSGELKK